MFHNNALVDFDADTPLRKAKDHYAGLSDRVETAQKDKVHNSLVRFWIRRYNYVTEEAVRTVILSRIGNESQTYGQLRTWMFKINRTSQNKTLSWMLRAVQIIERSIDKAFGVEYFELLSQYGQTRAAF